MRGSFLLAFLLTIGPTAIESARAERPVQKRENADCVVTGKVMAVYLHDSEGYRQYIVEIRIEDVDKGDGLKKGDTFRAFCYQRKDGKGGLEFDTAGHSAVPKEGQRIKAYVNRERGHNEGVYPDWFDSAPAAKK
jgi:hypothetical protein